MKIFEEEYLDFVLVPLGLLILGIYHSWLAFTMIRRPLRTVVCLNTIIRHQWVHHMMKDQGKNGILGVQTIRNNLKAATVLASTAITLSSLISAIVSSTSNLTFTIHTTKYLSVLICFLVAFFCNMQSIRYYAHVSFLLNVPPPSVDEDREEFVEYVSQQLYRGSLFWSLGLRAFYFSFPLLLWIFGAIAMLASSCLLVILLYFLDTATSSPSYLRSYTVNKDNHNSDIESAGHSMGTGWSGESNLHHPLLGSTKLPSTSDTLR
ncbi:uncharacterized protein LOC110702952 [Chenopodium quinoa]|uniref:uncharacterized protein LOC110702952 n=1 Tax=Chenopodium quinoa TaxID=63459 RepID=UPI000B775011|nr:uncharacterized protein LOC110702952 [Chenopodium quinoa]